MRLSYDLKLIQRLVYSLAIHTALTKFCFQKGLKLKLFAFRILSSGLFCFAQVVCMLVKLSPSMALLNHEPSELKRVELREHCLSNKIDCGLMPRDNKRISLTSRRLKWNAVKYRKYVFRKSTKFMQIPRRFL